MSRKNKNLNKRKPDLEKIFLKGLRPPISRRRPKMFNVNLLSFNASQRILRELSLMKTAYPAITTKKD